MSSLRDIVRRHIEAETLNSLSSVSPEERPTVLDMLRKEGHIDKKVQEVLDVYLKEIEENSPVIKKRKIKLAIYAALNLVLTIAIGYAVNEKLWAVIAFLAVINVIINIFFIFWGDE
jgi:hypothetical protein